MYVRLLAVDIPLAGGSLAGLGQGHRAGKFLVIDASCCQWGAFGQYHASVGDLHQTEGFQTALIRYLAAIWFVLLSRCPWTVPGADANAAL